MIHNFRLLSVRSLFKPRICNYYRQIIIIQTSGLSPPPPIIGTQILKQIYIHLRNDQNQSQKWGKSIFLQKSSMSGRKHKPQRKVLIQTMISFYNIVSNLKLLLHHANKVLTNAGLSAIFYRAQAYAILHSFT